MDMQFYRDSLHHHGVGATLYHAAYRAVNQVTELAVWNALVLTLDKVDEKFLSAPGRSRGRLLDAEAMRPYSRDAETQLTAAFLDEAAAGGDRCYALFEGDELVSYGWYACRPTRLVEVKGHAVLHFDPSYAYMYNGFTKPKNRGQRLHAVGMAAALDELTREGCKGLVSYVDSANFASLKSCFRMGYKSFGRLVMLRFGDRHVWSATPGCKKYDFRVETAEG